MSVKPPSETGMGEDEIFVAALELAEAGERERFLDRVCGIGTPRRAAIAALLEESSMVGDFLSEPAVRASRAGRSTEGDQGGHFLAGEQLGDEIGLYTLIDLIGEGGGGSVYLAEQSVPVRRTVALKILKLGMDTKSFIARFEAERQTLALMAHPNIARVIDAGATREGRPYFVMDYVEGEPLTEYCDARQLSIEDRLRIFMQVCRAVEHAHQRGIIHRDLKPSNILVTDQDEEPVPKVIDFGVAKAMGPLRTGGGALTLIETVIGTPVYMSPEQADRGPRDVDTRSDVYSLGVLLHELLTSYTPRATKEDGESEAGAARVVSRDRTVIRPSLRLREAPESERILIGSERATTMERLIASMKGDLDWVVMKCLERDRTRRFGSASDLARDLESYLAGAPVTARPPSVSYRVGKFVRRHRSGVAAGVLVLLSLLAVVAVSVTSAIQARQAAAAAMQSERQQSKLFTAMVRDQRRALQSASSAILHEYVADINLSAHALADGNIAEAMLLLDRHGAAAPGEVDPRGFEWRYLVAECKGDRHTALPTQDAPVETVAFSANGRLLAFGTRDALQIWKVDEGRIMITIPGGVNSAAFFPDREWIAVGGRDGAVVHDLDLGHPVRILSEGASEVALSDDGSILATSGDRGVTLWETDDWERIRYLPGGASPMAFSPDGEIIATGSRGGISLWSVDDGGRRMILEDSPPSDRGGMRSGNSLVFSRDGAEILNAQNSRPTHQGYFMGVWDGVSGMEFAMLPQGHGEEAHAGLISGASLSRKGTMLATSSWDHSVRLWDPASRQMVRALHGHRGEVLCVALSPDGEFVASGSRNGEVRIWPTRAEPEANVIDGIWTPLQFSEDGAYLAALGREGSITIFNVRMREAVHTIALSAPSGGFAGPVVSLSRDLKVLAEGNSDGVVRIRDLEGSREDLLKVASRRVDYLALAPRADSFVAGERGDALTWWDLTRPGEILATMDGTAAVFSAEGGTLAILTREGDVALWDTAGHRERVRITLRDHSPGVRVALSADGTLLATTRGIDDAEHGITLWDTANGRRVGKLQGHKQGIWSLAFAPDGRTIASTSGGGVLRFWNIETRRELLKIRESGTNLTDLCFSPDGQYLVGGTLPLTQFGKLQLFHAPVVDAQ